MEIHGSKEDINICEKGSGRRRRAVSQRSTRMSRWNVVVCANSYWEQRQQWQQLQQPGHSWEVGGLLGNSLVACWGGNLVRKKEISWEFSRAATRASGIHASFHLLGMADPCLPALLPTRPVAPD